MTGLKKNTEFTEVYRRGKSRADKNLVLYALDSGRDESRVGISVSKKIGNSVVRHRVKRRLREIFRLNQDKIRAGRDYVVIARSHAVHADYSELEKSVLGLMK